jgi:serine/threonine protein kinase
LSRPAGLPSWTTLRDALCATAEKTATSFNELCERQSLLGKVKRAKENQDLWVAFEILKEAIGLASYRATIREEFLQADRCPIPETYGLLWRLPLDGILNLNLDRLATRAHSESFGGRSLHEFTGKQAGDHMHILRARTPFVVNLHGIVADESSWVLTNGERRHLFRDLGYLNFVQACICTKTILFVGIGPDDVAVKAHLEKLQEQHCDFGSHYWITDRADVATRQWAESTGVRSIYYSSNGDNHSELGEFCSDLLRFIACDDVAPPVKMAAPPAKQQELPSPKELMREESEEAIRSILNAHAQILLRDQSDEAYARYNDFCKKYDQPIHRAWYTSTESPDNILCGYRLIEEIAEGGFGRVFRAEAPDGREIALKLLKADVRRKPDMMQSFRRGVRSMRILSKHRVPGMVPYHEASEIPAFAVMDYISGPNLQEAVESQYCGDWHTVLRIAVDLAHIIRRAHLLPERVLHRDIRPANIMLEGYYADPATYKVVVLDFDLSWHMGATEVSVTDRPSVSGFLAPEQVERRSNASTRNAAVDSFGLGMTLFYLRVGKDPRHLQHLHSNWQETLSDSIGAFRCSGWQSLPNRFARLIESATRDAQAERWDMSQIEGELELLKEAESSPACVQSAELFAEEIAARTTTFLGSQGRYTWNADRMHASISLPSGVCICLLPRETDRRVEVNVSWNSTKTTEHKSVRKYLHTRRDKSLSHLQKAGWQSRQHGFARLDNVDFGLDIPIALCRNDLDVIASGLAQAANEFRFD